MKPMTISCKPVYKKPGAVRAGDTVLSELCRPHLSERVTAVNDDTLTRNVS